MRVFVTGATGWVGTAVVTELLSQGHQVCALIRSPDKARHFAGSDVELLHGTLRDSALLLDAAIGAEGVVHLAFNHDWSRFAESAADDAAAIEVLGEVLHGTDTPLIVTAGLGHVAPGRTASEADLSSASSPHGRRSEEIARRLADGGVRAATIRLAPSVHGVGERHGLVPLLTRLAQEKGVSAYIGEGTNRWPAVHVKDVARLYRLVLESHAKRQVYHAVAEEGVPFRKIADAIGGRLGLPVEPREADHFGWLSGFVAADIPASSQRTRTELQWTPVGPDLLSDLSDPRY